MKKIQLILMSTILLTSCLTTVDTTIPKDISAEELFFKAQVQQGKIKTIKDYDEIVKLYQKIEVIFPEYKTIILESKYEIAFLKYQQKKYDEAEMLFSEILNIHEKDTNRELPQWSKTLSEIMIKKIDTIKNKKKKQSKKEKQEEDFYDTL